MIRRCEWVTSSILTKYHDKEWGVPLHNDRKLFEFLILDGAQAGLSWSTILAKRSAYRNAFKNFNPKKISQFTLQDVEQLMKNDRIVRNKMKIMSAINNSCKFLEVSAEFGSFDKYVWGFVDNEVILNNYDTWEDVPATSPESEKMSRDMKKREFTFVGPTICYAFMQSAGLVNDHISECFRRNEI